MSACTWTGSDDDGCGCCVDCPECICSQPLAPPLEAPADVPADWVPLNARLDDIEGVARVSAVKGAKSDVIDLEGSPAALWPVQERRALALERAAGVLRDPKRGKGYGSTLAPHQLLILALWIDTGTLPDRTV